MPQCLLKNQLGETAHSWCDTPTTRPFLLCSVEALFKGPVRNICHQCYYNATQAWYKNHPPRRPPAPILKTLVLVFPSLLCMLVSVTLFPQLAQMALALLLLSTLSMAIATIWMLYIVRKHDAEWVANGGWPYD